MENRIRLNGWHFFLAFFKIGGFTIGGGYAMLPLVREMVVRRKGWISEERFLELLTIAQGTPGVMMVNLSTLIGLELGGLRVALLAVSGAILPSFLSILLIASVLSRFMGNPAVLAFFRGAVPAVVGIIGGVVLQLAWRHLRRPESILAALAALGLLIGLGVNPILVILAALLLIGLKLKLASGGGR
ncbi:MAG TPA: chromate transporter [bacterium]|uniref:Putative chromate transport protein n=1 Tax=candidate division TA06 bacterium ADurb.Bin417 TaxID=1852828 RepID=A0A1V5MJT9_UNCT6|nr:MAG: putative chromate transport protein [candidate division TA06 bacterium ADurb.Bin417]HNQ34683.1 chromate transporter [bacterium]HNS48056.1 chromate transporter [bacterium]